MLEYPRRQKTDIEKIDDIAQELLYIRRCLYREFPQDVVLHENLKTAYILLTETKSKVSVYRMLENQLGTLPY